MRILRLRAYCYPESVAPSAMEEDKNEGFVKRNIVCINYTPVPSRGISDEVRKKYKKIKYEEFKDGHIIVYRFPMIKEGTNILQRSCKYLLCTVTEFFKGIKAKDIDVVFSGSTPPTQGMLSAMVAKRLSRKYKRKVPFVYSLQDIFPDSLVNAGMTKQGSFIWKIGRKIEDYTYRSADRIIVISEDFSNNIIAKGVPEKKIVIIPNWADTVSIHPVERNDNILFDRYNLDRNMFYISYCGNIGYSQNMDLLLDTAKEIKDVYETVRFIIIGDGAAKADVKKRIKDESIDNVIMLPFQPYEDIAYVFSLGDVGLIISKPRIGGSSVPSKTWSIMAAERPILASFDEESALFKLIKDVDCGICVKAGDRENLVKSIGKLYKEDCYAMARRGRAYIETVLNKELSVEKYIGTIEDAVNESIINSKP